MQLIKFTLRRGPLSKQKCLMTAVIHCMLSHRLSGAMEDCFIVHSQSEFTCVMC